MQDYALCDGHCFRLGALLSHAGRLCTGFMEKLDLGTVYWRQAKGVDLWLPPSRRELGPSALHFCLAFCSFFGSHLGSQILGPVTQGSSIQVQAWEEGLKL